MIPPPYLLTHKQGTLLRVLVTPKAAHNKIAGPHGEALKIHLTAPPAGGRANQALLNFLAKKLNLSKGALCIQAGETSRRKTVLIASLPVQEVERRLV